MKFLKRLVSLTSGIRGTLGLANGGTGQVTAAAAFDALNLAEATVASATTTDIGAATSGKVSITGVTTITGFGTAAAGLVREGRFTAALILTHNATSLILPGAANITTAAGDRFRAYSLGSGNWVVSTYVKADGEGILRGPITLIAKSVTVLTAGAPADIATIAVPAGITRWAVSSAGDPPSMCGGIIIAETAAGTLAGASFGLYDAAGGAGVAISNDTAGPASAGITDAVTIVGNGLSILSTSSMIKVHQETNSANAGTVSFYVTVFPLP